MKFYRVSREQHNLGETIWENGLGERHKNGQFNTQFFIEAIRNNDILAIGNFFSISGNLQFSNAYWEAWFEHVRGLKFPKLPVRRENMMVFLTLEEAQLFQAKYREGMNNKIYEIEVENPKYFVGDMRMFDQITSVPTMQNNFLGHTEAAEIALRYWGGEITKEPLKEIILYPGSKAIITSII